MNNVALTDLLQSKMLRLDVEFGNSHTFFSASKKGIYLCNKMPLTQHVNYEAKIDNAELIINDTASITPLELTRSTEFRAISDSMLFDFVSRFVILSDEREAEIDGMRIQHCSSNIYHQYPSKTATVPIGKKHFLLFSNAGTTSHPLFERVFYVRDEGIESSGLRRWIIHHRLIARQQTANLIVRCCHPRFEGPLPFQNFIPKALKNRLFRIREKQKPNFPFMAVGESPVPRGFKTEICTKIQLINE